MQKRKSPGNKNKGRKAKQHQKQDQWQPENQWCQEKKDATQRVIQGFGAGKGRDGQPGLTTTTSLATTVDPLNLSAPESRTAKTQITNEVDLVNLG